MSNIDILGIVIAPTSMPDYYLVDKLMVNAEYNGVEILLLINKTDLVGDSTIDGIIDIYKPTGYPIITLSCKQRIGFEPLLESSRERLLA